MKKLFVILCVCVPLVTGCTFIHTSAIRGSAKGFKGIAVPYVADLEKGDLVWYRLVVLTTERLTKRFMDSLPFKAKE